MPATTGGDEAQEREPLPSEQRRADLDAEDPQLPPGLPRHLRLADGSRSTCTRTVTTVSRTRWPSAWPPSVSPASAHGPSRSRPSRTRQRPIPGPGQPRFHPEGIDELWTSDMTYLHDRRSARPTSVRSVTRDPPGSSATTRRPHAHRDRPRCTRRATTTRFGMCDGHDLPHRPRKSIQRPKGRASSARAFGLVRSMGATGIVLRPRQCRKFLVDLQTRVLLPTCLWNHGRTACRRRRLHQLLQPRASLREGWRHESRSATSYRWPASPKPLNPCPLLLGSLTALHFNDWQVCSVLKKRISQTDLDRMGGLKVVEWNR